MLQIINNKIYSLYSYGSTVEVINGVAEFFLHVPILKFVEDSENIKLTQIVAENKEGNHIPAFSISTIERNLDLLGQSNLKTGSKLTELYFTPQFQIKNINCYCLPEYSNLFSLIEFQSYDNEYFSLLPEFPNGFKLIFNEKDTKQKIKSLGLIKK